MRYNWIQYWHWIQPSMSSTKFRCPPSTPYSRGLRHCPRSRGWIRMPESRYHISSQVEHRRPSSCPHLDTWWLSDRHILLRCLQDLWPDQNCRRLYQGQKTSHLCVDQLPPEYFQFWRWQRKESGSERSASGYRVGATKYRRFRGWSCKSNVQLFLLICDCAKYV